MTDPTLEVRDTTGEREVKIDRLPFSIGRRETNGLRLGGSEVSREHAEISRDGARYTIKDLQSRYGTFVNGEPVTQRELHPGDQIRLGRGGGADLVFLWVATSGPWSGRPPAPATTCGRLPSC